MKHKKHAVISTLIFLTAVVIGLAISFNQTSAQAEAAYIVKFASDNLVLETLERNQLALEKLSPEKAGRHKVVIKTDDPQGTLIKLRSDPNVVSAGFEVKSELTPNDPRYPEQWALPKISAPNAWDLTQGSSTVKIAVLDTGFALGHQDLSGRFVSGRDIVHGDNDPSIGQDCPGSCSPDFRGHGTLVAGVIGARANNSVGVAGIDWTAQIVPVQVMTDAGSGSTADVAAGIIWATDNGADVINMSLGTSGNDPTLASAVQYAYANGVIMAAAAGNSGTSGIIYPAKYSQVIAVGATDSSDNIASFSTFGPELDVVAPGVSTLTTYWTTSNQTAAYAFAAGTSLASPHVAGVAGLVKAGNPTLTNAQIMDAIKNGADKVSGMGGSSFTERYGYGRVNAYQAVSSYKWQLVTLAHSLGTPVMSPGQTQTITVGAKNVGTTTWTKTGSNPVRLGTWPPQRVSPFRHASWPFTDRPALMNQDTVAPGETATFTFTVQAPAQLGEYSERFNLVAEGITWMNDTGLSVYFNVQQGHKWQLVSLSHSSGSPVMSPGQTQTITVGAKNMGTTTWTKTGSNPVRLGTWPPQRVSPFRHASWPFTDRPALMNQDTVAPGETATFTFTVQAPAQLGEYSERFNLVAEGITWMNDTGLSVYFNVQQGHKWQLVSLSHSSGSPVMSPGQTQTITVGAKNMGTTTWTKTGSNPVRLGTWPPQRVSPFRHASWPFTDRPALMNQDTVAPGETATFTFTVQAPAQLGEYSERFNLVAEGITWMNDAGLSVYFRVVA